MHFSKLTLKLAFCAALGCLMNPASAQPPGQPQRPAAAPAGPGSGRFPAISEVDSGLPTHTVFRPANLDALVAKLADAVANRRSYLRWINVESGANVRLVTVEEICYFHADTKYTRLVTAEHDTLIRMSLKELLDVLDPAEFWQVHRSAIVNVNAIAEVSRDARELPVLHLKQRRETLQVSQPFAHLFRQM
jgi:DNA-binding LytR/AlgR family response regulator